MHWAIGSLSNHDDDGNIFAYLTVKSIFARFARAFLFFWHFEDGLVLSTTWNDLFCSCVDDLSIWWQMFNFVLCPKRLFQFNSKIVKTHFSSKMDLNNWKMIAETRSYIFRWHFRFCRRCVCLSSLISNNACKYSTSLKNLFTSCADRKGEQWHTVSEYRWGEGEANINASL